MNFNPLKKTVLVAALAFAGYGSVHAQVTTSNMSGVVTTIDGKKSTGATIKATHMPSGTVYSATANSAGVFNLSNMRVGGPYQVEVTYGNEKPMIYDDVYLELGQPFALNPVFGEKTANIAEVVLTGTSGRNLNKTGAATNIGQKLIQDLPHHLESSKHFHWLRFSFYLFPGFH